MVCMRAGCKYKETELAIKKVVLGSLVLLGAAAVGGWFRRDK